jgi:Ca2+-binding RTX toxin-like protein
VFHGANGSDTFDGAKGIDSFNGGGAADTLTGGNGDDSFLYLAAAASTGINHDTITDFDSNNADLIILDHLFNDVNAPLTTGTLSAASFDADMAAAITGAVMGKYDAVLFRPDAGDFDGDVFLVVDMNHKAGYQTGKDVVILMGNGSELGDLGAEDFGAVV